MTRRKQVTGKAVTIEEAQQARIESINAPSAYLAQGAALRPAPPAAGPQAQVTLFDGTGATIRFTSRTTGVVVAPLELANRPVLRGVYGWTLA